MLLALFTIFLVVSSNAFTESVVAPFGEKAMRGRALTPWGVVIQGVFLVIFFVLAMYLSDQHVL